MQSVYEMEIVMKDKGLLLVISGFSGTGKGTVVKRLLELHDDYALSISATTRKPRTGEVDGREYFFKSIDEFKRMIDNDELIEYAQYVNNYYGTPKSYVEQMLNEGKNVILEIEIQGALNIKKMCFPLVSSSFLRRIGFRIKERLYKDWIGSGYGCGIFNYNEYDRFIKKYLKVRNYEIWNYQGKKSLR